MILAFLACVVFYVLAKLHMEVLVDLVTAWGFKPHEFLVRAWNWRVRFPCTSVYRSRLAKHFSDRKLEQVYQV